ncbi:superoxide dismutase family protein [Sphingomonas sp. ID1715]|uniref:superoxide dismutase family protein n=1 Tax=Sphingomonas sp. ID1715 TaxID=1656898 RepID=UPI001488EF29|nr:superoxide dismutase family protein [Sphingomonas sp. ID1715]NNM76640.1 superoxide dismutase family protein [Sphingomonas sp. ID1715]
MFRFPGVIILGLAASACMTDTGVRSETPSGVVQAMLSAADGSARGTAQFRQAADGIRVHVEATGLNPGVHGIHVHTTGQCAAPDFATAGPHWNPTGRQHGRENPQGAHHGDLPNITIGADGRGTLDFTLPAAELEGLFDPDGAAIVVHANADDGRTDPSGNSGGRIACGVVVRG